MKELEFMEMLGELPPEYIEAASAPVPKKPRISWLRYGVPAIAACVAVVILAAVYPRLKSPEIPSVVTDVPVTVVTDADTTHPDDSFTEPSEESAVQPEASGTKHDSETQTLTQTEAEATQKQEQTPGTQKNETNGTPDQQPNAQQTEPPKATDKNTQGSRTTAPAARTTAPRQTTVKRTTVPHSATTAGPSVTTRATTRATARITTARATTVPVGSVTTRRTERTFVRTTQVTKPVTRTTTWSKEMQGQNTEANMTTAVDYTRPAVTPPDETKSEGTLWPNEQPSTSTDPVKEPVHQGENAGPLPQESIKWQVYNPDESSDQMECDAVVLTEFPSDDLYTQLSDFDFDTFDCLVISLKTHATDASLYSVELADGYAQISGLVFRQSYDPTQRHFLFAVAVPKGYSLWEESVFDWNLTGDASSFYDSASYATTVVDIIY